MWGARAGRAGVKVLGPGVSLGISLKLSGLTCGINTALSCSQASCRWQHHCRTGRCAPAFRVTKPSPLPLLRRRTPDDWGGGHSLQGGGLFPERAPLLWGGLYKDSPSLLGLQPPILKRWLAQRGEWSTVRTRAPCEHVAETSCQAAAGNSHENYYLHCSLACSWQP